MIEKGLDLLHKNGLKFNLSGVLTENNFNDFNEDFIDFAKKYNCPEVQILLGMQDDYLGRLSTDQVVNKLYDLRSYGMQNQISITGYWHNAFAQLYNTTYMRGSSEIQRGTIDSCTATGYQLSVEPSGDVFPCKAMSTYLGSINDLKGMLKSDNYHDVIMRTYGNVKECYGCPVEGFCQGECLGNIEQKYDDIYRVDTRYCDIYRGINEKY